MTGYSYAPAQTHEWLAVATAGRLLVARVDDGSDRVGLLAATGDAGTSVQQVLEVLTAQGLRATGPFALLFWVDGELTDKGLGVIVRGDAVVTVDTADGTVSVSSRGVTTWTEQVIESPTGFTVELNPSAPSAVPVLPLQSGAAWVSRVTLAGDHATASTRPESASAVPAPVTPPAAAASAPKPPVDAPDEAPVEAPAASLHEETRVFHTATRGASDDVAAPEAPATEADADGYDYLFGATVFRPVGAAAVEQPSEDDDAVSMPEPAFLSTPRTTSAAPAAEKTSAPGDHDGRTMLASDILAARQKTAAGAAPRVPAPQSPAQRPAGHRYVLELPGGESQALTAPVILGRAPSVSNVPASVLPHLVTLTGDDISRSHVRVSVEGDTVVVTDLHSSNGTHVIAPGKLPQLLRAGEPTPVITGTAIDLGSDIVLRVSEA